MTLTDDELRHAISASITHILDGIARVRQRRAEAAIRRGDLSIRASRAERRRASRERPARPARQRPLLTPHARRMDMIASGDVRLTELDSLLTDEQARALEEWALCEEMLSGRTKSASWEVGRGGGGQSAPIPDAWLAQLNAHGQKRVGMRGDSLKLLAAFTALQNGSEVALSPAQYGMRFFPEAQNKRLAFLRAVAGVARKLV